MSVDLLELDLKVHNVMVGLTNLPTEILELIADFVLVASGNDNARPSPIHLKSLLLSCHSLYRELHTHTLHDISAFACNHPSHAWKPFLTFLGMRSNTEQVRSLELKWCSRHATSRLSFADSDDLCEVLQRARGLRRLR